MTVQYNPYRKGTVLAPSGPTDHLHIICSDPIYNAEFGCDCVLVVNVSSVPQHGGHDSSCILQAGDHRFVQHDSFLVYRHAVLWRVPTLTDRVVSGVYNTHDDVSQAVLDRVIQGFRDSDFTSFKILRFMDRNNI